MKESQLHSHVAGRAVKPLAMSARDCRDYGALSHIGITLSDHNVRAMMSASDSANLTTRPSIATPVQFLQGWLPGFVEIITSARKIDELVGIDTIGAWEDEEIVQGIKEPTGQAPLYGDISNIPLNSWNANFETRTVVRFESGFHVGRLEELRSSRMQLNSAQEKRNSASLNLEIQRNRVGFYGYNNGENRTYGLLNDPALLPYQTLPKGTSGKTTWDGKTFLEITADIRVMMASLRKQSGDTIAPEATPITLGLPTSAVDYLSVTSDFGISVRDWIAKAYPSMRIVSAPEFESANGGANVAYLYAESVLDGASDGGRTFAQSVPAKFQMLGVDQGAKGYTEDFSNATAGVLVKRPYAVVRVTGV
ncbi:major capsid family protein [Bartonella sp. LJL80]